MDAKKAGYLADRPRNQIFFFSSLFEHLETIKRYYARNSEGIRNEQKSENIASDVIPSDWFKNYLSDVNKELMILADCDPVRIEIFQKMSGGQYADFVYTYIELKKDRQN